MNPSKKSHPPVVNRLTLPASSNLFVRRINPKAFWFRYKNNILKILSLMKIWTIGFVISFAAIMLIYTIFFGHHKRFFNEAVYNGAIQIYEPNSVEIYSDEGYGVTSYGQKGLVVDKEIDPEAFKVVFIGDSFVQAKGVSDHEKFTEIVEHEWNRTHPDDPIQSLNLGLEGMNMWDYLVYGPEKDTHFEPDLVFILLTKSDFQSLINDQEALEKISQGLNDPLLKNSSSKKNSTVKSVINDLGIRSFFVTLSEQTSFFLKDEKVQAQSKNRSLLAPPGHEAEIAIQLKGLKEVWGDRLVIVYNYFNFFEYYDTAPPPPLHAEQDAILKEIKKQGIPVVDLYPMLLQSFLDKKPPYGFSNSILGKGHFNQYGHQLVAAEIVKYLEATE